jgi:hypothetical protein
LTLIGGYNYVVDPYNGKICMRLRSVITQWVYEDEEMELFWLKNNFFPVVLFGL